jgi:hypothetical protein
VPGRKQKKQFPTVVICSGFFYLFAQKTELLLLLPAIEKERQSANGFEF